MKIVISGVEGVNKGAELMLYAILKEIEHRFPHAVVYLPISQFPKGLKYIRTNLELRQSPNKFVRFLGKYHITGILNRLRLKSKYLNNLLPIKGVGYYLDASGLFFSDQMIASVNVAQDLNVLLHGYREQGTKIIYLPQAFGPFNKTASSEAVKVALDYADLIIARDDTSYGFLCNIGRGVSKVTKYFDFTGVLHPECPVQYQKLVGKVCLIPNNQIIRKGVMSRDQYLDLLLTIIKVIYDEGYEAFFLDHADDADVAVQCVKRTPYDIPIVTDVDALTVKAIISQSYLCVSSRFHGVVSSLSSAVPCLTTSWNHKYQELLKLYDADDSLLSTSHIECVNKVKHFLSKDVNKDIRERLHLKEELIKENIQEMWTCVWSV